MLGPFYNRMSGNCAAIDDKPLFGLWTVSQSSELAFLNSVPMSALDYVVPDLSGRWSLVGKEHARNCLEVFSRPKLLMILRPTA
jgi:hypothetical protein